MKKRFVVSLLPTGLAVLLLGLTEVGLRLFVPSLASPLVQQVEIEGRPWLQVNRRYLERYFPAGVTMVPELKPSLLRKVKAVGGLRVFCVGESSMFGTPYELTATIPALVRKQLRHLFPGREIEVINFGASAINSNAIVDMAAELAALEPDAVLLYAGHNEFYGPDGVGAPWLEKQFPRLTAIKYGVRDFRLVRLALRAFPTPSRDTSRNLMYQVSAGAHVELSSADAHRVLANFERNLAQTLHTFRSAGIPVIVSDVTSNLLFPPFLSSARKGVNDLALMFREGRVAEICRRLAPRAESDTTNADLQYWLGASLHALQEPGARRHLVRARDADLLKFRAPSEVNIIIRSVSRRQGAACVSSDSLFASLTPQGIPDRSLFCEHLHPSVRGYDAIARLFVSAIMAGEHPDRGAPGELLPFNPDSLNICWLDLAYADLSLRNLTGRWPFTDFAAVPSSYLSAPPSRQQIALDVYNRKIGWIDGCYRSAEEAGHEGDIREAIRTYGAMTDEFPFEYYPRYRLGYYCKEQGSLERAAAEYRVAVGLNPGYVAVRLDLGLLENNAGNFASAIDQLNEGLRLTGENGNPAVRALMFYGRAAARANTGDLAGARQDIGRSLTLAPSYLPARTLARSLQAQR